MDFLDFLFAVVFAGERFGDFFHVASTCDGNEICSDSSADQVHGTVPDECAHVIIAMRVQTELRHRVVYGGGQIAESIEERAVQVENEQFFLRDESLDFVE